LDESLKPGECRELTDEELTALKNSAGKDLEMNKQNIGKLNLFLSGLEQRIRDRVDFFKSKY
jgi:hypothetical protein